MQRRLRTAGSIVRSPSLLAASVSQHTARERSILCVAAIDAELEVCCESGAKLRTNHGPRRPHSAHLNDQPSSPANSGSRATTVQPDLRVKGSRVQISPARQVNVGLSHLIRAAFIRPPAHPRLASAPGSWAQIGPTSASTPPQHRARPGDPGEDNGSSPPGLDGQPTMRDVDVTHLQAGHLTDP